MLLYHLKLVNHHENERQNGGSLMTYYSNRSGDVCVWIGGLSAYQEAPEVILRGSWWPCTLSLCWRTFRGLILVYWGLQRVTVRLLEIIEILVKLIKKNLHRKLWTTYAIQGKIKHEIGFLSLKISHNFYEK